MTETSPLSEERPFEVTPNEIDLVAKRLNGKTLQEIAKEHAIKEKEALYWKKMAFLDPLTNVLNKRGMEETFERIKKVLERKGDYTGYTIIFVDAVGLKTLNETKSYYEGNQLLKGIAEATKSSIGKRGTDLVARAGGDEFVRIALNETEEQINQALNLLLTKLPEGTEINIGMGFWNSTVPFEVAFEEASSAVSVAKSLGELDKTGRTKAGHIVYTVDSKTTENGK